MRSPFLPAWSLTALLSLSIHAISQAQTQAPPVASYDPHTSFLRLDWQSASKRTFFPQASTDLDLWSYIGTLHFGEGSHYGVIQSDAPKAFFRLQYSDLPVDTEAEAETADFDLDGLQNLVELQETHTDPLSADTDKDGLPDGWEVAHSIDPLDDGSIDPANGPDGVFLGAPPAALGSFSPMSITTNKNALDAGVQAHPSATLSDKDGDQIPDESDAGPLSRAIDWATDKAAPKFLFQPLLGYDYSLHGTVRGCNNLGVIVATQAIYFGGSWHSLAEIGTGSLNYLPIKIKVDGRDHDAFVGQPTPSSIADDGRIVGDAPVYLEPLEEEIEPNHWVTYQPAPTQLAFIWDSWDTTPRLLAHASNSILAGNIWDESPQISADGTIVIRRRSTASAPTNEFCFIRYDANGGAISTAGYPTALPAVVGGQGLQAFNAGSPNAYSWLPGEASPRSLLADSTFSTPNPRSSFYQFAEPIFIGNKPGSPSGYCLNFWGKTMIRHEGQWREAVELGDTTLITTKGIAFKARTPNAVQVWKGGQWNSLAALVTNKNFSLLNIYPLDSTDDGRILISYYGNNEDGNGFLIPLQVAVDANRDGNIEFGKEKNTLQEPYHFWVNDDLDKGHSVDIEINGNADWEEDDVQDGIFGDSYYPGLEYRRDLEDLTRLWIDFSGISEAFPASDPTVALKVRIVSESGSPRITLFQPVESDGGRQYLKDYDAVGFNQTQGVYGQELCRVYQSLTSVEIPRRAWENLPSDKVVHLLFEGAEEGEAEVIFELWKDGAWVCDFPTVYISLEKASEMYETWTVGDVPNPGVDYSIWPESSATQTTGQNLPVPTKPEEQDYIMFVHGWNMPSWEKETYASTMFKRMWHQGYKGRFGTFRWPTFYGFSTDEPENLDTAHFDGSEQRAWNSASALKNLLANRESVFGANRIRLYAHSMGNIVCSEALRQMSPNSSVRIYISAQAALSSHVWDSTTPNITFTPPLGVSTPNIYSHYWQTGASSVPSHWDDEGRPSYMDPQYMPAGTVYINHYNPVDWALSYAKWQRNQALKPDVQYRYSAPSWDMVNIDPRFWKLPTESLSFPSDRFEIFSYAASSHGYATGQQGATSGMFEIARSLNLAQEFNFESAHKGHSAQFRSTIQKRWTYWRRALIDLQVQLPPQ